MKISLRKVGGVVGMARPATEVDTDDLSELDQNFLRELVERAAFFDLPEELEDRNDAPDTVGAVLEIVDEGRQHVVGFHPSSAPPPLHDLITKVRELAHQRRS